MPEIKNTFTGGRMNKDLDERLVSNGEYRDGMNIQVSTSESSSVGAVTNVLGNKELDQNIQANIPVNATCVGSVSDEKNDHLYWFVQGEIFDYDSVNQSGSAITSLNLTDSIVNKGQTYSFKDLILRRNVNASVEGIFVDTYLTLTTFSQTVYPTGFPPVNSRIRWN